MQEQARRRAAALERSPPARCHSQPVSVRQASAEGEIRILPGYPGVDLDVLEARPVRSAAVVGDTLGNRAAHQTTRGRISGFSLTSGARLWSVDTDDEIEAVTRHGVEVWVIGGSELTAVSLRTGLRTHEIATRDTHTGFPVDLWILRSGGYALVRADGGRTAPVNTPGAELLMNGRHMSAAYATSFTPRRRLQPGQRAMLSAPVILKAAEPFSEPTNEAPSSPDGCGLKPKAGAPTSPARSAP